MFTKAKLAKEKYEYAQAKEVVDIKLLDIKSHCLSEDKEYSLESISIGMTEATEITIDQKFSNPVALKREGVDDVHTNLIGIAVSVNNHPQFEFLIGKNDDESIEIIGVASAKDNPTNIEDFTNLEYFENEIGYHDTSNNNGNGQESENTGNASTGSCTISISNKGTLTVSGISNLKNYAIIVNDEFYTMTESNGYFLGILNGTAQYTIYVIATDVNNNFYKSNVLNYFPEVDVAEILESGKTTTSVQAYADGSNTHSINLSEGTYVLKITCNCTFYIESFTVDGLNIGTILPSNQNDSEYYYYFTTKTSTTVKWYCNRPNVAKYLYINYKKLPEDDSMINATVSNSNVSLDNISFGNCTISISKMGELTINGISDLESYAIIVNDEFYYLTDSNVYSFGTINGTVQYTVYVIAMDENNNFYKSNVLNYVSIDEIIGKGTSTSVQAYADGSNTHSISLTGGTYLLKLTCNCAFYIQSFVVDGVSLETINQSDQSSAAYYYYFTTTNSTTVNWYCNRPGTAKYLSIKYKKLTEEETSLINSYLI